jgi:hypothetical protein
MALMPAASQAEKKTDGNSSASNRIVRSTVLTIQSHVEVAAVIGDVKLMIPEFNQMKQLSEGDRINVGNILFMDKGSKVTYRLNDGGSRTLSADKTPISYTVRASRK